MVNALLAPEQHAIPRPREQSRARYPDRTGFVERPGGRVAYEVCGSGDPPIVFVPPWQIVHARIWKAQIPDFARRHRVVAWDNLGNGHSDRPLDPLVHTTRARAANLAAVMDAAEVPAAVVVGLSSASGPMVVLASEQPERVLGLVFVCPAAPIGDAGRFAEIVFEEHLDTDDRWAKENIHFWRRDYRGYLEYFFSQAFPEPHSTKQIEDGVGWGLDTNVDSLAATKRAPPTVDPATWMTLCASIRAPALVIQGTDERLSHLTQGVGLAQVIPRGRLELIDGGGHMVNARDPIRVNLLIREFIESLGGEER
jgi:pimeloyl-ACP methyl ester carboxylesterase